MTIPPILTSAEILENRDIVPGYFHMRLNSPELASRVIPGQFFHIRVEDRLDIILRRPFSVFDYDQTSVSILYEVVGKGTALLSRKRKGEVLDILGPLGNGFTIPIGLKKAIIAAGGMGVAPLFCLAKELKQKGVEVQVLIGAKNRYKVLCEKDFRKIGIQPEIATDDGSYGHKGFVTDLYKSTIARPATAGAPQSQIDNYTYACGPNSMLKELTGVKGEISLDTRMGCGVGVCLGCVVKTINGKYKRVCKDGPVFKADEIDWS